MSYLPENVATKGKPTSLFSEDALQTVQRLSGATVQIVTNDTVCTHMSFITPGTDMPSYPSELSTNILYKKPSAF
jgi:hypothetical protein